MAESFRISNNSFTKEIQSNLMKLGTRESELMTQISSGQRITVASDDPEATARVTQFQSKKRELIQFQKNATRAQNVLNLSLNAAKNMKKLVLRAQEIARITQSGITSRNFNDYAKEINQLLEQAVSAGNTEYLGNPLFAGTALGASPFSTTRDSNGKITAVAYAGNSGSASFHVGEKTQVNPHTSGTDNNNFLTAINNIRDLRNALESSNTANITTSQTSLITSENDIIGNISTMGAKLLRANIAKSQNETYFQNIDKSISSEVDIDFAQTIVELNRTQTSYRAAMQRAARVLNDTILNYIR